MRSLVENLSLEKDAVIQWHMQAVNITTNVKFKVYFTLPVISATYVMTWNFYAGYSAKGGYDMILSGDILIELGLNLKKFEHFIEAYGRTFKGYTTPVVDLGTYIFKDLNIGKLNLKNCL